ncbi:MAG: hypothetical protein RID59_20710, partial [Hoeflea sp.]
PETGLDCVGLVAACLREIGREPFAPSGYGLRNRTIDRWISCARRSGLAEVADAPLPGDIALVSPAVAQHHLIIIDHDWRAIHAHAGLRRVVSEPLGHAFLSIIHWRLLPRKEAGLWRH